MVKMVGIKNLELGSLVNKIIEEKVELAKENKQLRQIAKDLSIRIQQYEEFYGTLENNIGELNIAESGYSEDDIVDYKAWESQHDDFDAAAKAYAEYYN
ncbi:hypothetical protein [Clostridium cuniculi]|uniref:hypothetical protein n=1 Tax=Clostridium cuniculi TaxID=2548455 RepID=UPI001055995D|nr:hypothetical protein [Clostridium cuniculi]